MFRRSECTTVLHFVNKQKRPFIRFRMFSIISFSLFLLIQILVKKANHRHIRIHVQKYLYKVMIQFVLYIIRFFSNSTLVFFSLSIAKLLFKNLLDWVQLSDPRPFLFCNYFSRGRQRGLAYKLHSSLIASFSGSCTQQGYLLTYIHSQVCGEFFSPLKR